MATKNHRRFRCFRRLREVGAKVGGHWIAGLLARGLAAAVVTLVARWLGLQSCGRP